MQDPIIILPTSGSGSGSESREHEEKCPRCESTNTKFCYYNNYNLSQPRHFCKNCRRYWTKGGTLRNIPVGGGTRKNSKRSNSNTSDSTNPNKRRPTEHPNPGPEPEPESEPLSFLYPPPIDPADDGMLEIGGSFSSLLHSTAHFGNFLDAGFGSAADPPPSAPPESDSGNPNPNPNPNPQLENFLGWPSGWADLTIYTSPGSTSFQ